MALTLRVGPIAFPVGTGAFLGAFFDTVTVRLESGQRGTRFAALSTLYEQGVLAPELSESARAEVAAVRKGLQAFAPASVVWDMADPSLAPPWGDEIAPTITDLSNYFVTSDGRQILEVLDAALETSGRINQPLRMA